MTDTQELEPPRYQLIQPLYVDDQYIPADEVIETDHGFIPNEGMMPLNEAAKRDYREFLDSLDGGTPDLGDVVEHGYRNRPRHPVPQVPMDRKKVRMPDSAVRPPLSGYDPNTQTMTAKREPLAKHIGPADQVGTKRARKVMGTVVTETAGLGM